MHRRQRQSSTTATRRDKGVTLRRRSSGEGAVFAAATSLLKLLPWSSSLVKDVLRDQKSADEPMLNRPCSG
jgi:hypothetical protein